MSVQNVVEMLLRDNFSKCPCGKPAFPALTRLEHDAYREYLTWSVRQLGRPMNTVLHCKACTAKHDEQIETDRFLVLYEDAIGRGVIPDYLPKFRKTPPRLMEMNPHIWSWTEKSWSADSGNMLVCGHEGVGKSSLCRYCLTRAFELGMSIMETSGVEIEDTFWRFEFESHVTRAKYVKVLLIDDISNVDWSRRGIDSLRRVLEPRHEARLCTLLTSNKTETELHEMFAKLTGDIYAGTLMRRIRPVKVVQMTGDSYRLKLQYGKERTNHV